MPKTTLSSKVSEQTKQKVQEYADEKGISRSEAVDRLVRKSLKMEDKDIVVVSTDGGTKEDISETKNVVKEIKSELSEQGSENPVTSILTLAGILLLVVEAIVGLPDTVIGFILVPLFFILAYDVIRGINI